MRKHLLFGLLFTGTAITVIAQDGFVGKVTTLTYDVFDNNGKAFVNPSPDVAGSPFLNEDWRQGSLIAISNRRFDTVKLRLDVFSQEVHFLDRNNNEMALAKGYIKEVLLPGDFPGAAPLHFRNGFPAVDGQDVNNFYQVVVEGKLQLLLSVRKLIVTHKDDMSGEVGKEYQTYQDYYLYDGITMQRVKKDKAVIGGKEIKFRTIDDLKKAVGAYNVS
jgi:hypothetical protein